MRFLMKIVMPTADENALMGDPQLDQKLRQLYASAGGLEAYSRIEDGRRVDYILLDIVDLTLIAASAKRIFETLHVKPEFYPQKMGDPLFGQ